MIDKSYPDCYITFSPLTAKTLIENKVMLVQVSSVNNAHKRGWYFDKEDLMIKMPEFWQQVMQAKDKRTREKAKKYENKKKRVEVVYQYICSKCGIKMKNNGGYAICPKCFCSAKVNKNKQPPPTKRKAVNKPLPKPITSSEHLLKNTPYAKFIGKHED